MNASSGEYWLVHFTYYPKFTIARNCDGLRWSDYGVMVAVWHSRGTLEQFTDELMSVWVSDEAHGDSRTAVRYSPNDT